MNKSFPVLLTLLLQCFSGISQSKHVTITRHDFERNDLIANGDFIDFDSSCLALHSTIEPCPEPFQAGCINAWRASHGSPEFSVEEHAVILGAVKSGGYVWGEGIFQTLQYPVDSGSSYFLFIDYQLMNGTDKSSLSVQLTNQEFQAGSCFEMLPSPGWEIYSSPMDGTHQPQSTVSIIKTIGSFSKIWFCTTTESDSVAWIKIQNIHLFPLDNLSASEIENILDKVCQVSTSRLQFFLRESNDLRDRNLFLTTYPGNILKVRDTYK